MAEEKKYTIGFRLYAEVKLTAKELKAVASGDSTCIENKYKTGDVKIGGGDSYIPLEWIQENDELPSKLIEEVNLLSNYSDLNVDI